MDGNHVPLQCPANSGSQFLTATKDSESFSLLLLMQIIASNTRMSDVRKAWRSFSNYSFLKKKLVYN
jgi:hypothetical protein